MVTKHRKAVAFALFSIVTFGAAYTGTKRHLSAAGKPVAPGNPQEVLPSTSTFVPFTAEIRAVEPLGSTVTRYYQNSTGSSRREAYSPDGSQRAVTIQNLEQRITYFQSPTTGEWSMLPMLKRIPSVPRKMNLSTPGLSASPEDKRQLGYSVHKYTTSEGTVSYLAPDLNLFPLLRETSKGRREEVVSVVRGEPSTELFAPPRSAKVRLATDVNDLLKVSRR